MAAGDAADDADSGEGPRTFFAAPLLEQSQPANFALEREALMASEDHKPLQQADARRARGQDIMTKLTRALRPKPVEPPPPLPTAEEFERLLDRFECEYTRAFCTYIWTGTWIEILALSHRLFVDKGDLIEFYARDYAFDLLVARDIEGLDDGIRGIKPGDYRVTTIDTIARDYLSRPCDNSMGRNTVQSHLTLAVRAYSPDATPQLEIIDRVIEVLRRNGSINDDDPLLHARASAEYHEREDRYERECAQEREARTSGAVTPVDAADDDA